MFTLNTRLAGFYFFYYSTVGAFMAYWAPYLLSRGFTPAQVGVAYALMGLSRATVPVAWAWWADRRGKRVDMIRAASLVSLLIFTAIPFTQGVYGVMALMLAYTLFWNALIPQFEVVVLGHLQQGGGDYSRIRLWGSVGFIAGVLSVGPLLDVIGIQWEPWLAALLFAAMAATAWSVPEQPLPQRPAANDAASQGLQWKPVLVLLFVCFCSQLSYAPYYSFFTVYLEGYGYSRGLAGQLWALGVIAEIVAFLSAGRIVDKLGVRRVMVLALSATVLRWCMTGLLAQSLAAMIVAQLLHSFSFGFYHLAAIRHVQRLFPTSSQGRGQALYNAASYGVGGSIGSLASGYLWQSASPEMTFMAAAVVAAIGVYVAWRKLLT